MRVIGWGLVTVMGAMPAAALAQQQAAPPARQEAAPTDHGEDDPDIVVTGSRNQPGAVIGDIPPEVQLGPADIRSYGVSSVSDLIDELSPQTTSTRGSGGAPVVLLNGRRISSFAEIRDIPTEAIARVDILPEEVALKYGYPADQKVVNVVLRRRFRAITVEAQDTQATKGGQNSPQGDLDVLTIQRDTRVNVHLKYQQSSALFENERDIANQPGSFSAAGNVVGAGGRNSQIDPLLSAAAGSTVTVAGVPTSAATARPSLADFVGTAGVPTASDQTPYRTLLPSTQAFSVNTIYARPIGDVSATVNARLQTNWSEAFQGLPGTALTLPAGNPFSPFSQTVAVDRLVTGALPLSQTNSSIAAHLGTTLGGGIDSNWRWSVIGNYDRTQTDTVTDTGVDLSPFQTRLTAGDPTANPFGPLVVGDYQPGIANRGSATASSGGIDALFTGRLFAMPAGPVQTSIRIGGDTSDFSSRSFRAGVSRTGDVSRDTGSGQLNIDLPIASHSKDVLPFLGTLSLNGNVAVNRLSDFGTLTTVGYGANWSPIDSVRVIASVTDQDDAPTAQQLGNPVIATPNVRIFDYVSGSTVSVTQTSGGNPLLRADNRHTTKVGLTLKPWRATDFSLIANYVAAHTDDPIASFPTPTAAIEAAFPGRFTRDASGTLTAIDSRPVNFARTSRSELRWGFNFSKPLKSRIQRELEAFRNGTGPNPFEGMPPPPGFGGARPPGQAGGGESGGPREGGPGGAGGGFGGGPGGGRGGFGGRGGGGGGRLQFALYHTWHFTDRVLVRDGGPLLDLLGGDAIGASGGSPRHEIEAQAGYNNNGLGARLSANYQSGTRVNGGTAATPQTLAFSDLATANLRLFADLGQQLQWVKAHPWLRGMRVTLAVTNLFNTRQRVRDANGDTPVNYQPDYLDPLGRAVKLSVRKLF